MAASLPASCRFVIRKFRASNHLSTRSPQASLPPSTPSKPLVSIFTSDAGAPEGGTGRRFFTEDRRADLTVQSVPNPGNDSPATFLARKQPPAGISYKRITSDFFVVSSIRKDRIWYNRCNRGNGTMNCVLINYPSEEKRQWDDVVTRISRTLRS